MDAPFVPQFANVDAHNINGRISLEHLHGAINVRTVNGDISANDVGPDLTVWTDNGSINASLTLAPKPWQINLLTTNGKIIVTVPRGFNDRIDALADVGTVSNPFATVRRHGTILLRSEDGNVIVSQSPG
jgi:DUF4097 and DUF4098 domain-containing protein YvlB